MEALVTEAKRTDVDVRVRKLITFTPSRDDPIYGSCTVCSLG